MDNISGDRCFSTNPQLACPLEVRSHPSTDHLASFAQPLSSFSPPLSKHVPAALSSPRASLHLLSHFVETLHMMFPSVEAVTLFVRDSKGWILCLGLILMYLADW